MTAKFAEWYLDDVMGYYHNEKYDKFQGYNIYRKYINIIFKTYYIS